MTVESITNKARRILQDTVAPYRWTDEEMRDHVDEAVLSLNRVRPETRYVEGRLVDRVEIPPEDSETQDIAIDPHFEEALVFYVAYKCYLDDDTDTVNAQLSESYLAKFNLKAQL